MHPEVTKLAREFGRGDVRGRQGPKRRPQRRLLGLQTPPAELAAAANALHANAVGLTVTAPPKGDGPKVMLRELRRLLPKKTALWVGGAFASSVAPVGATVINSWAALDAALGAPAPAQLVTVTP